MGLQSQIQTRGCIDRFKARSIAHGFSQRSGVDFSHTFSPVVKLSTLRIVLAPDAARGMHAHSADFEFAFLNADLQKKIHMRQPKVDDDGTPKVMRLFKSIYGLKLALREWYSLFYRTLTFLGLKHSTSDTSLYYMNHHFHVIYITLVYVDDILIVSDTLDWIRAAKLDLVCRPLDHRG
jgi:hypothetical protein